MKFNKVTSKVPELKVTKHLEDEMIRDLLNMEDHEDIIKAPLWVIEMVEKLITNGWVKMEDSR